MRYVIIVLSVFFLFLVSTPLVTYYRITDRLSHENTPATSDEHNECGDSIGFTILAAVYVGIYATVASAGSLVLIILSKRINLTALGILTAALGVVAVLPIIYWWRLIL